MVAPISLPIHYKFRDIGVETNIPLQPEIILYCQVLQHEGWNKLFLGNMILKHTIKAKCPFFRVCCLNQLAFYTWQENP